ncbi:MAG TPA: hypothetical protein IAA98_13375 [Candidatus Avipropionibacterium avicola]|uniref:Uncharacterized protein n=1 Tax=Candidatus Avipropionibacterium avicola TaxID=2840701 RepID=A0A9D1GZX4_9ACTN|nr:hypothetical protein [Candidatus Avipropionibacterium avicola]
MTLLMIRTQLWWQEQLHRLDTLADRQPTRNERGNNSIEMAIIIGVVIIVATLIGVAIKAAVDARLPNLQ